MDPDPVTASTLRAWLKQHRLTRHTLAAMLMVSKSTVDGWCAGKPIHSRRQDMIRSLMEDCTLDAALHSHPLASGQDEDMQADASLFTFEEWDCIRQAARLKKTSPIGLMKKIILLSCKNIYRMDAGKQP